MAYGANNNLEADSLLDPLKSASSTCLRRNLTTIHFGDKELEDATRAGARNWHPLSLLNAGGYAYCQQTQQQKCYNNWTPITIEITHPRLIARTSHKAFNRRRP
jgi:hypothetical protein